MPRQESAIDELTRILRYAPAKAPAGAPQLVSWNSAGVAVEVARMANLCSPKSDASIRSTTLCYRRSWRRRALSVQAMTTQMQEAAAGKLKMAEELESTRKRARQAEEA